MPFILWYPTAEFVHWVHHNVVHDDPVDRKHPGVLRPNLIELILRDNEPPLINVKAFVFPTAAYLLREIALVHAYDAGNKRTALFVAGAMLDRNGYTWVGNSPEAARFMRELTHLKHGLLTVEAWLKTQVR